MNSRTKDIFRQVAAGSLLAGSCGLNLFGCGGFDDAALAQPSSTSDTGSASGSATGGESNASASMSVGESSGPETSGSTDTEVSSSTGGTSTESSGTGGEETSGDGTGSEESSTSSDAEPSLDEQLAELLANQPVEVVPLEAPPKQDPKMVELGQALFFDPILSGNKDIACATCHHPSFGLSDGLSLSLGTGAVGLGPERADGEHPPFVPRHAQQLSNIGQAAFTSMFWDGRVQTLLDGSLDTPAKEKMLPGVGNPLAAQVMFPVLDRREMRGEAGSRGVDGEPNELAEFDDDDVQGIWAAIMERLMAIEGYRQLFAEAFPRRTLSQLTFADAANAIAAFETEGFSLENSRWDQYLRGDLAALTEAEKDGAIIFYGDGGCGTCHSGPLLTDHKFHNTAIPQFGPGQWDTPHFDHGRQRVSAKVPDRFGFRTPSLRNVALSPPYMHNGAFPSLIAVMLHYKSPKVTVERFDLDNLHPDLQPTLQTDPTHINDLFSTISSDLNLFGSLAGISNVVMFMEALSDLAADHLEELRPESVPSGLDVP